MLLYLGLQNKVKLQILPIEGGGRGGRPPQNLYQSKAFFE